MKHAIYILLAALALLLASCKKKRHDDIPQLSEVKAWRQIGMISVGIIWYPDSISFKRLLLFENKRYYKEINQDTVSTSGTYELMTVTDYWTHKKVQGIRFSGDNLTYTLQMQHDTLVITKNDGALDGYVRYYKSVPTM